MASIGHVAVGMAAARLQALPGGSSRALLGSMCLWSALALLPDADVIGFSFGIPYAAAWGHRGATHSLVFSVLLGVTLGAVAARLEMPGFRVGVLSVCVLASHTLLDTLTDGGLGCALFWPFSNERHFASYRPIPVAPIGLGFLSARGLKVAVTELALFAPLFAYALWPRPPRTRLRSGTQ